MVLIMRFARELPKDYLKERVRSITVDSLHHSQHNAAPTHILYVHLKPVND